MLQLIDPKPVTDNEQGEEGLASFTEIGVIVYHPLVANDFSNVEGLFALPVYRGNLAREELVKEKGPTDCYDGTYASTTWTAGGEPRKAATGTLTIVTMDPKDWQSPPNQTFGRAHWIFWNFLPAPWLNAAQGYASGTRLRYVGVGIEIPGDQLRLAASWSNNIFTRVWVPPSGTKMLQYGLCGNALPANPAPPPPRTGSV